MLIVDSKYTFDFSGPFASRNGIFTVISVATREALVGMAVDVKQVIFLDKGYTEADYQQWLAGDQLI